jgi:hypothetical protein
MCAVGGFSLFSLEKGGVAKWKEEHCNVGFVHNSRPNFASLQSLSLEANCLGFAFCFSVPYFSTKSYISKASLCLKKHPISATSS